MELIFICKADLKIHSVKRSQEIYRLRRYPLFPLPFLTLAIVLLNLIPSGCCQIWPEALRPGPPRGWVLLAWVTGKQTHSSLGYRLQRPWNLSEPHRGVLP